MVPQETQPFPLPASPPASAKVSPTRTERLPAVRTMASVQEEGRSCTTKPRKPVCRLRGPDHVPPMGKVLGLALSSHSHGPALPGETSHFLSASRLFIHVELPRFPEGVILQKQKWLRETTNQNTFWTRTAHPSLCHLLGEVILFHPRGDTISSPRTQKHSDPVGFPAGSWTPGLFRPTLTVLRTGHRL